MGLDIKKKDTLYMDIDMKMIWAEAKIIQDKGLDIKNDTIYMDIGYGLR